MNGLNFSRTWSLQQKELAIVIGITIAAIAIRLFRLGNPALWMDEATTLAMSHEDLSRLFGPDIRIETSPPIYYALQHFWLIFGDSREVVRLLPLIFGVLTIPAGWLLGRRIGGWQVGVITAALIATGPEMIHYSREIRSYSMLIFSTTAALTCLVHVLPRPGEPSSFRAPHAMLLWGGYTFFTALATHSHNTAILFPFLTTLFAIALAAAKLIDRTIVTAWFTSHVLVLLAFMWWLVVLFEQMGSTMRDFWLPDLDFELVKSQLLGVYPYWKPLKVVMAAIGAAGAFYLLRCGARYLGLAMLLLLGQPLMMMLISLHTSVFLKRALVWPSIMFFVLLAIALVQLPRIWHRIVALCLVFAIQLSVIGEDYPAARVPSEVEPFLPYLQPNEATDAIIIAPQVLDWAFVNDTRQFDWNVPVFAMNYGDGIEGWAVWMASERIERDEVLEVVSPYRRVWLVIETAPRFPIDPPLNFALAYAELGSQFNIIDRWESPTHDLVLFERNSQ